MGLSLLPFLLLFLTEPTLAKICPESCGINSPPVRFPFGLTSNGCNYPGFNLSCNYQDQTTTLSLPNSGNFTVQFIDYLSQTIYIKDPNHCLPKRYLYDHFTLSGSPFIRETFRSFAFLSCSSNSSLPFSSLSGLRTVPCLSNEANTIVVAMNSSAFDDYGLPSTCKVINQSVSVPVPWPRWSDSDTRLTWNDPDCRSCEQDGGTCGFVDDSDSIIGCYNRPKPGMPRSAKYGIIIGVGIPGLLCLIGVACYLCGRVGLYGQQNIPDRDFSTSLPPQTSIMITGLDGRTIDSYPKTQLGESRRLPKPNDNTCPICLCEYEAKETIRTIPECNHYFHADCIDEWLKMNASCPLCRNSPESSSIVTPSTSMSSSSSSASTP